VSVAVPPRILTGVTREEEQGGNFTDAATSSEVGEAGTDVEAALRTPTPSPTRDAAQEEQPTPHRPGETYPRGNIPQAAADSRDREAAMDDEESHAETRTIFIASIPSSPANSAPAQVDGITPH